MNDEEKNILTQLGLTEDDLGMGSNMEAKSLHPAIKFGLGTAFILNVGFLLSLPPVLRGRGRLKEASILFVCDCLYFRGN